MVLRTVRAIAWMLVTVTAVFALSGCNNTSIKMKLANVGAYPITELLVYPRPAAGGNPGAEAQINRMPNDASGSTIALLPNDAVLLDSLFRNEVYDVSLTFYDSQNQIFRKAVVSNPLDLTAVKPGSLAIVTADIDANNTITATYEIVEDSPVLPSLPGWEFIVAAAMLLLSLLYLLLCHFDC